MILLDTNIFIYFFQQHAQAQEIFKENGALAMSSITAIELQDGALRGPREQYLFVHNLFEFVQLIPVDKDTALLAGKLLAEEKTRKKMRVKLSADLIIAATAINMNIPLLTANVKDFQCFTSLKLQKFTV